MPKSRDLLSRTLRSPDAIVRFSMSEWDVLVRQARAAGLLARLAHRFRLHGLADAVPSVARWHFDAAETLANKQQIAVRWELQQLRAALADLGSPLIVLKGAAYVAAHLPAAEGRLFNDIDIPSRASGWPKPNPRLCSRVGMQPACPSTTSATTAAGCTRFPRCSTSSATR